TWPFLSARKNPISPAPTKTVCVRSLLVRVICAGPPATHFRSRLLEFQPRISLWLLARLHPQGIDDLRATVNPSSELIGCTSQRCPSGSSEKLMGATAEHSRISVSNSAPSCDRVCACAGGATQAKTAAKTGHAIRVESRAFIEHLLFEDAALVGQAERQSNH